MRYIKEYSEYKICDRCGSGCEILTPSMYNKELLCLDCKKDENTGHVTGDDLRNLDDENFTSDAPIFPQTTASQMIYNL